MSAADLDRRLRIKLHAIREELRDLTKSHDGRMSLRCLILNDQCDLLEDLLDEPRTFPRATSADR